MDWNKRYEEQDTPWDKDTAAPILDHYLNNRATIFQNVKEAMVPGCGTGHDAALLASHGIKTTGIDISKLALVRAESRYSSKKLTFLQADIFQDLPSAHFDMVWEHTCFCAIEPSQRDAYVEHMANTLKPNGFLIGIFFIETGKPANVGPPYKASIEEIKTHFFNHFHLEYQESPPVSYPERVGKEHLMLFRRLNSCLDGQTVY